MSSKFPDSGDFSQFILHEVILHLVDTRFSGSIDLQYEEYGRILRFDNGSPCAASSAAEEEQIDTIIRAEQEPLLTDEQRDELAKNKKTERNFGKALVDSSIISSSDLLDYNRTQAKMIFTGALREKAISYILTEGEHSKHNPLNLNIANIVRQSILNDLEEEVITAKLDDENISYKPDKNFQYSGLESLKEDEELKSIISHLKNGKPASEVVNKVGLNPERSRRNFLFLKLLGWIKTTEDINFLEEIDPLKDEDAEISGAVLDESEPPEEKAEESDDILKLLGEEDTELYDVDQSLPEMPALADPDDAVDEEDIMAPGPAEDVELDTGRESFAEELLSKSKRKKVPIFVIGIVAMAVLIVVGGISFFIFWPKEPAQKAENDISFYDKKMDKEQLPLDQDFRDTTEQEPDGIEIKVPKEDETKPAKEIKADPPGEETKEDPPVVEKPVEKEPETAVKEPIKKEPVPEVKEEIKPEPEAKKLNNYSWEEAQPIALDAGFRQSWKKGWEVWEGPLSRTSKDSYSIYITSTVKNEYVSSVFEEFANSSRLRDRFFVVWTKHGKHQIYWGIFPTANSARVAMANLPGRITKYKPQIRKVASIR